ncbi:hypothetical protein Psuf_038240 [Phytohabitans suffuscus]|uniref:CBM6 domain-containing protein n=1 Tax=Phytohabitans suffuscus TaxID=624315 RepID=A0A6F8YKN8_9ACTN|nr:hypothetical protein Psuf_038240 [Phytohabitans suffuscus]
MAGAAALASLGAVVLVGAVRFERPAGETAAAQRSPEPAVSHASPHPSASAAVTATPTGVPTPTAAPTTPHSLVTPSPRAPATGSSRPAPASTPGPTATAPAPRTSAAPARFTPISVQAEHPDNTIAGGARVTACATCDGGARVRYLGKVVVYLDVPTGGTRTVTVTYEADGHREIKVAINSAAPRTFETSGTGWDVPRTFRFTAAIPAGRVAIALYNDTSSPPDVDKVTIS